jgi:hypothetical protein
VGLFSSNAKQNFPKRETLLVHVDARTLRRRQVVYTIPTHLQQQKREAEQSKSYVIILESGTQMQIQKI